MARSSRLISAALRERRARLLNNRSIADRLISVAGLVGRPVRNQAGERIGKVEDVVVRWGEEIYPPVSGLVVCVGIRSSYVAIGQVAEIDRGGVVLRSARVDLIGFHRREGEVVLVRDVMDHQVVDVDGLRVVRSSDLYLAPVGGRFLLVGVDVGLQSLVRRAGPSRWRARPTPERVIDWAAIQPFHAGEGPVQLRRANQELRRLRPAELADLLEQLGRPERQELLEALEPGEAADALEEMKAEELSTLLREAPTGQAAGLVAEMEPDEAVDALRELDEAKRAELLDAMPNEQAASLEVMLGYPEGSAGGYMTTELVVVAPDATVGEVCDLLRDHADHQGDIDSVLVVGDGGRLVDDVTLFELLLAPSNARMEQLVGPPWPVTVSPNAPLTEVVECLIDNRRSSLVVVDDGRPLGRILADDVIDALVPDRGRLRFPRMLR